MLNLAALFYCITVTYSPIRDTIRTKPKTITNTAIAVTVTPKGTANIGKDIKVIAANIILKIVANVVFILAPH